MCIKNDMHTKIGDFLVRITLHILNSPLTNRSPAKLTSFTLFVVTNMFKVECVYSKIGVKVQRAASCQSECYLQSICLFIFQFSYSHVVHNPSPSVSGPLQGHVS